MNKLSINPELITIVNQDKDGKKLNNPFSPLSLCLSTNLSAFCFYTASADYMEFKSNGDRQVYSFDIKP